jgi:hypothetical protein
MLIRLLKTKMEEGKVKTTIRENRGVGIVWLKGQEVEVSESTGAKLIAKGEAEAVVQEAAPVVAEEK